MFVVTYSSHLSHIFIPRSYSCLVLSRFKNPQTCYTFSPLALFCKGYPEARESG